jgi:hypothetical protein
MEAKCPPSGIVRKETHPKNKNKNRTQPKSKESPRCAHNNNTLQKKTKQEKEVHSAIYIPRRFNYWVLASSGFFDNAFCHFFYSPKRRYSTADRYSRRLVLHITHTHTHTHTHTNLKAKLLETQSCCCFWWWEGKGQA